MSIQTEVVDITASVSRARFRAGRSAFVVGVCLLVILGLVLRLYLLTHLPIDGDESVAGLMADQILRGHFYTFFWGNQYGGGEFYLEALLFSVFGGGAVALNGTAVVVTAVAPATLPALTVALTAAVLTLSVSAYDTQFLSATGLSGLFRSGPNPNGEALTAIRGLESHHIRDAYADYWVAYNLDFLSHERLRVADPSADRWAPLYREVQAAQNPAWIFYNPKKINEAEAEFRSPDRGPFAYSESLFLGKLAPLHIGYRIIHLGVLDAIVTSSAVRQEQVGMGQPLFP
jgi:hypothetical protein